MNIENKTVSFLDFLGFKNHINNTPLLELAKKYQQVIINADAMNRKFQTDLRPSLFTQLKHNDTFCWKKIFSDSIILVSKDNSVESCLMLLLYTWKIMQACLASKMPVRGGIVNDEFFMDKEHDIFLGKALTKAYELENQQDWIGISIDDSINKRFQNIFSFKDIPYWDNVFLFYDVPLKNGLTKRMRTINWRFNFVVDKGTKSLFPSSADIRVQKKINNTLDYAKYVVNSGAVYTNDNNNVPIEFSVFWVGATQPPFSHGDEY